MTHHRQLELVLERDEVPVGDSVTVRVRDGRNRSVEDVTVRSGSTTARTDENGRCRLTFQAPGFWSVDAIKSPTEHAAYEPATALVRAVPESTSSQRVRRFVSRTA